jgi:predicted 2-oxoglutarate/Fe(II)-dependent dioxygenase YbiX
MGSLRTGSENQLSLTIFELLRDSNKIKTTDKDGNVVYKDIFDIEILKYENTGFYTWHVDHFATIPRTMSCILLLNNDYEGGNLCFRNPDGSGEWEVEVKPNRMIIWPSNFLYPHTVKSVTKGKRYSVVAWAL